MDEIRGVFSKSGLKILEEVGPNRWGGAPIRNSHPPLAISWIRPWSTCLSRIVIRLRLFNSSYLSVSLATSLHTHCLAVPTKTILRHFVSFLIFFPHSSRLSGHPRFCFPSLRRAPRHDSFISVFIALGASLEIPLANAIDPGHASKDAFPFGQSSNVASMAAGRLPRRIAGSRDKHRC